MPDASNEMSEAALLPLRLFVSDQVRAEAKQIADWLREETFGGEEAAIRFSETLPLPHR